MLSAKESALLTRVGPGTPLGEMMRRYWHPIALSTEVAADGAPLRTKLLGQQFVVFRDTDGKVGVLDEFCMHRGVSLALGRNEEGGLRCIYHGWKFAVDGTILETPNHADCRFRERLTGPAYPVREQSGLIWTYIGPRDLEPPFRTFEYDTLPAEHRWVFRTNVNAAWLPLWEGGLDSSHVAILHTNQVRPNWGAARRGEGGEPIPWDHLAPTYEMEDTDYGFRYSALREVSTLGGRVRNVRRMPAIMPYGRIIPTNETSHTVAWEVPMDDARTATFLVSYDTAAPVEAERWVKLFGYDSPLCATGDIDLSWDRGLGQRRERLDSSWSGMDGLMLEDVAMSVSLNGGWDRAKEHLVASDVAIVRMRSTVKEAIRRTAAGLAPHGVDLADMTGVVAQHYDMPVAAGQAVDQPVT